MKRLLPLLLLVNFAATHATAQQTNDSATNAALYQQYNRRTTWQRNVGIGLVGGGVLLTTICTAIGLKHFFETPPAAETGLYIGVGMLGAGIPFVVAATINQRKARRLKAGIKMQSGTTLNGTDIQRINYPAVSLKLSL